MPRPAAAVPTLTDHLAEAAQQQLAALRADLEGRLTMIEEVLADPTRGESLPGLILELARVATEEAQAAATEACLTAQVTADTEIAELRNSAKAAVDAAQAALRATRASLEEEKAASAVLRKAAEQARIEIEKQAQLLAARQGFESAAEHARERLEAELAHYQTVAVEATRRADDAARQLEAQAAERANDAARQREAQTADRHAHDGLAAELARERSAGAAATRALGEAQLQIADAQRQIEAGRSANADLRQQLERLQTKVEGLERERTELRTICEAAARELAHHRETASARSARAEVDPAPELRAHLEAEQALNADLRQSVQTLDQQLSSARAAEVQAVADRDRLRAQLDAARDTPRPVVLGSEPLDQWSGTARPEPPPPPAGTRALSPEAAEEFWRGVRLAHRYVFKGSIPVQVNGDTAWLNDLSVTGCQVLAPQSLKPNQLVKVRLSSDRVGLTCTGRVVWTRLEPAGQGRPQGYRAGVQFRGADEAAIEAFAAVNSGGV